jgi:ABC-type multidrug transport system permease subunit
MAERTHSALVQLTLTRMREFWRDPGSVFWTFGFPILTAIVLGLAFRSPRDARARVAVVCEDGCSELQARLSSSPELLVVSASRTEAMSQFALGKFDLVVERDARGERINHWDPSRPESRAARNASELALRPNGEPALEHANFGPGSRYVDFLVPGLLGVNLLSSSVWGIGFSIAASRRRNLLKQYATTPMPRSAYLGSLLLARLAFVALEVCCLIGFAMLVFDLPLRGSWSALLTLAVLGACTFTGIAMLVSSSARSVESVSGRANLVVLPMWLLSGVFFSYERFPDWSWPFLRALPLTALNAALRRVILEGAPLLACASELGIMLLWGTLAYAVAVRTFRWT